MFFLLILRQNEEHLSNCHSMKLGGGKMAIKSGPKNSEEPGLSGRGNIRTRIDRMPSGSRS